MKIAILHEMLVKFGGAEKVVESFMRIFPNADLFTLIYDEEKIGNFFGKEKINFQVFSLPSQKIYKLFKKQRLCLPFMTRSVEQLDFTDYDIVICSSSWFAHQAITKPETKFIVYYHSPARYLWDWTNEYKKDIGYNNWLKWFFLNKLLSKLRISDYIASNRVDLAIANSKNTNSRIKKYYKKESIIIYPPVEIKRFSKNIEETQFSINYSIDTLKELNWEWYYIIISALTEFKKIEIAIEWFNKLKDKSLIVIWEWNYKKQLKSKVDNNNIFFAWAKYSDELVYTIQNSLWLIFPWEEDFWIVPIEVMASWKPIFAFKWWWLLETVLEWITWEFFDDNNWFDFTEKFKIFDEKNKKNIYKSENCIKQAMRFSEEIFEEKIKKLVY